MTDRPNACPVTWPADRPEHTCVLPIDHRVDHESADGITVPQCGAEYAPERRDRGARIVRCQLDAGHRGDHEEVFTGGAWPADHTTDPTPTADPDRLDLDEIDEAAVVLTTGDRPDLGAAVLLLAAGVRQLETELDTARRHLAAALPSAIADDTPADLAEQLVAELEAVRRLGLQVINAHSRAIRELEAERDTARRDGAADGILLARDHVSYDDREVLTLLAQHVRDGLTIPTTDTTEETL